SQAPQTRHHIKQSSHVRRLFLDPNDVASGLVALELRNEVHLREGIQLVEKNDGGGLVFAFPALDLKFVTNLPRTNEDAVGMSHLRVRHNLEEAFVGKVLDRGRRVGMPQHALGSEDNQRLAPVAQRLAPEQMKVLGRV